MCVRSHDLAYGGVPHHAPTCTSMLYVPIHFNIQRTDGARTSDMHDMTRHVHIDTTHTVLFMQVGDVIVEVAGQQVMPGEPA